MSISHRTHQLVEPTNVHFHVHFHIRLRAGDYRSVDVNENKLTSLKLTVTATFTALKLEKGHIILRVLKTKHR